MVIFGKAGLQLEDLHLTQANVIHNNSCNNNNMVLVI